MRPLLILGVLFLSFSWTLGCGTVGKDFDMEQAKTIENGKTTREAIGEDSSKSLIVEFDDNGVVRNHSIMTNEPAL